MGDETLLIGLLLLVILVELLAVVQQDLLVKQV